MEELRQLTDVLIVDAPLAPKVGGVLALAGWVDGVVLVTDRRRTRAREVVAVGKLLHSAGANQLGLVLNEPDRTARRSSSDAKRAALALWSRGAANEQGKSRMNEISA
jgi:Mrp family chromosome partitioning ATPase